MTEMIRLTNELKSIGNNLNQSVKKLHILEQISEFRAWIIIIEKQQQILEKSERNQGIHQSNFRRMVAIIHNSLSLKNALLYNENKVRQKVAIFFHSANYSNDIERLHFYGSVKRFKDIINLNKWFRKNTLHSILKFHNSICCPKKK
jgi:hypothetical protein